MSLYRNQYNLGTIYIACVQRDYTPHLLPFSDQIPAVVSSFRPFHPQVSIHRDLIDTLQPIRAERSPRPRYIMHILYKLACSQPTVSRTIGTGTSWFCLRGEERLNTNNRSHTNPSKSSQAINLIQRHVL